MVYNGNSENKLGDLEVTPISENPPYYNLYIYLSIYPVILYVHIYITFLNVYIHTMYLLCTLCFFKYIYIHYLYYVFFMRYIFLYFILYIFVFLYMIFCVHHK